MYHEIRGKAFLKEKVWNINNARKLCNMNKALKLCNLNRALKELSGTPKEVSLKSDKQFSKYANAGIAFDRETIF